MFAVPNNFCRGFFVEYETEGLFIFLHQSDDVVTSSLFVTKSFSVFVNWKTSNTAKSCSSYLIFSSSAPPILTRPVGWTWTHSRSIVDPPIVIVILIPSPVARNSNTHHNLKKKKNPVTRITGPFSSQTWFFLSSQTTPTNVWVSPSAKIKFVNIVSSRSRAFGCYSFFEDSE